MEHAPIIVEIVDSADKISRFVSDTLEKILVHGLATLERAAVSMYRHRKSPPPRRCDCIRLASHFPCCHLSSQEVG